MVNVTWVGGFAYLFGRDVYADFGNGAAYSFDYSVNISTSLGASMSARWNDGSDGTTDTREIRFKFWPNEFTTGDLISQDAAESGWQMYEAVMTHNNQSRFVWENIMASTPIRVPPGYDIFHCERLELNMHNENTMEIEGRFIALDFMIGGYLDSSYHCEGKDSGLPECNVEIYNPCHMEQSNGECSAIDGEIFCGDNRLEDMDSSSGVQPIPLDNFRVVCPKCAASFVWVADNAYLKTTDASVTLAEGAPRNYTFVDDDARSPTVGSGSRGQAISRQKNWVEDGIARALRFLFEPNKDTTENDYDPQQDAADSGWVMGNARIKDNNGTWINWASENSMITVPRGDMLFFCEKVILNFVSSISSGRFEGNDFTVGSFLRDGYNARTMKIHNPCSGGERCRIEDDQLFCSEPSVGHEQGPVDNSSVGHEQGPVDNSSVGHEQGPVYVAWVGDNSFLKANGVEATLEDGAYTFLDDGDRPPNVESGGGALIAREGEWTEKGTNRQMVFSLSQTEENNSRAGWELNEFKMSDNSGELIVWTDNRGGPFVSFVRVPYGYSVFFCERVELTLRDKITKEEKGKFTAHDFTLGAFLPDGYEVRDYKQTEYNPCTRYNRGECEIMDDALSCGSVQNVPMSDLLEYSSEDEPVVKGRDETSGSSLVVPAEIVRLSLTIFMLGWMLWRN